MSRFRNATNTFNVPNFHNKSSSFSPDVAHGHLCAVSLMMDAHLLILSVM